MKRTFMSVITLAAILSLYGCNTIGGVGDDLQAIGRWITNGSDHVEESIKNNPPGSGMEK